MQVMYIVTKLSYETIPAPTIAIIITDLMPRRNHENWIRRLEKKILLPEVYLVLLEFFRSEDIRREMLQNMFVRSVIWFFVYIKLIGALMDGFKLNIDDILDEKFMPISFFLKQDSKENISSNSRSHFYGGKVKTEGDFTNAYSTMGFHRKKMNEYLCSNFVANQILFEIAPKNTRISRRLGTAVDEDSAEEIDNHITNHRGENDTPKETLLYDPGSSGYKNWLSKTTTLDDIYRQFGKKFQVNINKSTSKMNSPSTNSTRRSDYDHPEDPDENEYEEGDITGYAMHRPMQPDMPGPSESFSGSHIYASQEHYMPPHPAMMAKPVYHPFGYMTYPHHINFENSEHLSSHFTKYEPPSGGHMPSHESFSPSGQESYDAYGTHMTDHGEQGAEKGKELGLKDFMDIALTTLAFLAFGMFILQVLMCITMSKNDSSNMMMMPMEAAGGGDEATEEIRRMKRSPGSDRIKKINEISRRVLLSIEAVLLAPKDDGKCLQKIICNNNRFARDQKDGQKIWIPVWGLGLSWLAARFTPGNASATATLNGLKASAIGLGGGDCENFYKDCDFQPLILEREILRRKRRNAENVVFEWSL